MDSSDITQLASLADRPLVDLSDTDIFGNID